MNMMPRTYILVLLSLLTISVQMSHQQQCLSVMNIVFAVDGSNSLGDSNFQKMKTSLSNLVLDLPVGQNEIHASVVLFSRVINAVIPLTGDKNILVKDISALEYPDEETMTNLAIDEARRLFKLHQRNESVPNVLLIITDGKSSQPNLTSQSATLAKSEGIEIYAVGVTVLIDRNELEQIASSPNKVFITEDFTTLEDSMINATRRVCSDLQSTTASPVTVPTPEPVPDCQMGKADLLLVVDVSRSAESRSRTQAPGDFMKLKSGLTKFIENIQKSQEANSELRLSLISYSDSSVVMSSISQPNSFNNTANAVLQLPGGIAQGGSALISALTNIRVPAVESGYRSYVAIVATESSFVTNMTALEAEFNRLSTLSYTIVLFVVRESGSLDQRALQQISSGSRYFYFIPDYLDLPAATFNFTRDRLCQGRMDNTSSLCADSGHREKGVGVVAHPADCDKYIQCYYNEEEDLEIGVVRQCPMGLHYSRENMTCVKPSEANCSYDRCKENCEDYKMEGTCSGYWQCQDGVSTPKCCSQNYTFVPQKGCQPLEAPCVDHCGPETSCGKCQKKPNWEEASGYDVMIMGGNLWMPRPCFFDDFDIVDCDCTAPRGQVCPADRSYDFTDDKTTKNVDEGTEEGITVSNLKVNLEGLVLGEKSSVHVSVNNKQSEDQPFTIEFRFREMEEFSPYGETLVSSGLSCGASSSLVVSATNMFIFAEVRDLNGQIAEVKVPTQGLNKEDFKDVVLVYENGTLRLSVRDEQTQYVAKTQAPRNICLACGLNIGQGFNKLSFEGAVQKIAVYSCAWPRLY